MSANKLEYLTEDISFLRYFPILYLGIMFFTRNLKSLFLNQNRLVGLPDEIGKQRLITQHLQLSIGKNEHEVGHSHGSKAKGHRLMVHKRPPKKNKKILSIFCAQFGLMCILVYHYILKANNAQHFRSC